MTAQQISIILADDHPIMLAGIRGLIDQEPDMACAGEASDGLEALCMTTELLPDVLVHIRSRITKAAAPGRPLCHDQIGGFFLRFRLLISLLAHTKVPKPGRSSRFTC
jgi:hypothetical protein